MCIRDRVHWGPLAILWHLQQAPACNTFSISGGSPRACASVVVLLLWKLPPWCTTPRLMVHHTTHPGALRAEGDKLLLFWRCARNNFLLFRCCAQNIKPISTRGQKMTEIEFTWPIYCKMSNIYAWHSEILKFNVTCHVKDIKCDHILHPWSVIQEWHLSFNFL